jgi:hypothetical protein
MAISWILKSESPRESTRPMQTKGFIDEVLTLFLHHYSVVTFSNRHQLHLGNKYEENIMSSL